MKHKIGIFGSAAGDTTKIMSNIHALADVLSEVSDKVIIVTGACPGIPYEVASRSAGQGVEVWGFSPALDLDGQKQKWPDNDNSIYSQLFYIPKTYEFASNARACLKFRNVSSTATCDAGIIIAGRWGSLNEFTNLIDLGKTVGVLTGTGGVADELERLSRKFTKEGQGLIIFDSNPKLLIAKLFDNLENTSL